MTDTPAEPPATGPQPSEPSPTPPPDEGVAAGDTPATVEAGPAAAAASAEDVAPAGTAPPPDLVSTPGTAPPAGAAAPANATTVIEGGPPPVERRRRWLPLASVGLLLVAAALAGYGAAFLVPRFVDVSPPAATGAGNLPPSGEPSPSATEQPSASSPAPTASGVASPSAGATPTIYVVKTGDTLAAIAARYGVTIQALIAANGIKDPNHIETGQRLLIPPP